MIATAASWSHVFRLSPSHEADSKDDNLESVCLVRRTRFGPQFDSWIPSDTTPFSQPVTAPESTAMASTAAPVVAVATAAVGDSSNLPSIISECSISNATFR